MEKDKNLQECKEDLSPQQYEVMKKKETEPAFSGLYWNHHQEGVYRCGCCKTPLFSSENKFDSGTGWPSFCAPVGKDVLETEKDTRFGTVREEVHCANCGSHMGHVFSDGPEPTGLRYCINSISLDFKKTEQ
jgi:peptide-methionine (R)-S-oxide reductase